MNKRYLLFAITLLVAACALNYKPSNAATDDANFVDGRFVNNHMEHPNKDIFAYLKLRWFGDDVWADHQKTPHLIPKTEIDIGKLTARHNHVTWLGHSTFLLQFNGLTILTDPVFSERASPVSFAGPKRYTQVAMPIADLPKIDLVVISHNHYDHLDERSIKAIGDDTHFVVPSGLKAWFIEVGISGEQVTELKWWQQLVLKDFTITAMPSQHWSARGLGDRFKTHWASWLITANDSSIWFAGDTGYNDKDFVDIGDYITRNKLSLDLALIPIGAYGPRSFMKAYHVNTAEAVQIHKDIGSKYSIGMHWGAFPLTSEPPMEPFEWLNQLRRDEQLGSYPFETLKIGETKALEESDPH